jgi:peptidyl-prolyl cis-trans isomerase C
MMGRQALLRPLSVASLPLLALLGCGGSHDKAGTPPATEQPTSAEAPPPAPATPVAPLESAPVAQAQAAGKAVLKIDPQRLVATVNGKPIVVEQVFNLYRMNKDMLLRRGRTLNEQDDQALRAQSLEVVIADELLYQAALANRVPVPAQELEAGVKKFRARAGSEEAYKKFLAESKLSEADVRREIGRNIQTEAYRKSLVTGTGVTEDQAKKFYDANAQKGMFDVPEQVHVQYILVKATEKDPESVRIDARKRAEDAAKRAAAGEDFGTLAKQYSQDPTADRGGDIGFFPRGVMFPKFEQLAFAGKPGDVTPVFETPTGFNVMKIIEKSAEATKSFDEVKSALMLDMGRLMEQDIVMAKVRELAAGAKIQVLDASYARPAPPVAESAKAAPPPKP